MKLVSDEVFRWFLTAMTGGVAAGWLIYDAINLWRARAADRRDLVVRDRRFGYVMGIVIGAIGVIGVLRFNGVL